ncbi:LOW QUALITY PROTEIN: hypothetical protein HID58_012788 [Brassica napus]|uniref:Uncharacterized protein n=3 Tax=Brassica TaxID=3705 RepID=A0ABQ8E231_BRANA|nr:LOW QUALITY PROTEIN: hypothetical protein HID58_012788 [Brassica napus]
MKIHLTTVALEVELKKLLDHSFPANIQVSSIDHDLLIIVELLVEYTMSLAKLTAGILPRRQGDENFVRIGNFSVYCPPRMISVVIITELLVEYTTALAKLTAGILPRRRGDTDVIRIGGFSLRFPSRSTPVPDFSSHLVDF